MSLAPPTVNTGGNATGSGRTKVALKPGHSLMDWVRLSNDRNKDLTGVGGRGIFGAVTEDDLRKHATEDDPWIAVRGEVYNIKPYLEFHPGGVDEIMRGAGKDATQLFNEIHKWVNVKSMLSSCYIGPFVETPKQAGKTKARKSATSLAPSPSGMATLKVSQPTASSLSSSPQKPKKISRILAAVGKKSSLVDLFKRKSSDATHDRLEVDSPIFETTRTSCPGSPVLNRGKKTQTAHHKLKRRQSVPTLFHKARMADTEEQTIPQLHYNWDQTDVNVIFTLQTNYKKLDHGDVVVRVEKGVRMTITVSLGEIVYEVLGDLYAAVTGLAVNFVDKWCDVCFTKQEPVHWPVVHKDIPLDVTFTQKKKFEMKYYECKVRDVKKVTHDTKLLLVEYPALMYVSVPVGHHVYIRHTVEGFEVSRPYTPVANFQGDSGFEQGRTILLMIKIYPLGSLTQHIGKLELGSTIDISSHDGTFNAACLTAVSTLCLIGAGSGFTPMAKLIREFLDKRESVDREQSDVAIRQVKLLCANKTVEDIMWAEELDALLSSSNGGFEVCHTLSKPSREWTGLTGRISKQMLEDFFPSSDQKNVYVCYCGNLPFNVMIRRFLRQLGFQDEQCHLFK